MRVLYIDTLFFINLIINYLLLLGSARITGRPFKRPRLAAGAAAGAAYAVLIYFPHMSLLGSFAAKIAAGVLMVAAAFGFRGKILRTALTFLGLSFLFGGGVMAAYIFTGGGYFDVHNGIPNIPVDFKTLFLATALCYALSGIVLKRTARHGGGEIVLSMLTMDGHKVELRTLIDTGNTLTDPITNTKILVAEAEAVRPIFSGDIKPYLDKESLSDPARAIEDISLLGDVRRWRLIPYRAVGVDQGMLLAFRPDSVTIAGEERRGALVALSPNPLSDGGGYAALSAPD